MSTGITVHPSLPEMRLINRRTQEHVGACPFCGGDHRSDRFHIWLEEGKKRYWCRNCNAKGPLHRLLGEDPRPIIDAPKCTRGRRINYPTPKQEHIPFYRQLYTLITLWAASNLDESFNPEPLDYLRHRGLSDTQIRQSFLGVTRHDPTALVSYIQSDHAELLPYAEEAGILIRTFDGTPRTHPTLCGSILIPYIADGDIVDLRMRSYPGKGYKSLSGSYAERGALFPFLWDEAISSETVIITEGEFKALVATQAYRDGHLSAPTIAHPGLSYFREEWAQLLRKHGTTTVVLAYDTQPRPSKDGLLQLAPEEIWTIRHGQILAAAGLQVRVLRLPLAPGETKADLDEYILRRGAGALDRLLSGAPLLQDYHRSLPCTLLRQAKLPLAGSHPRRRARPKRRVIHDHKPLPTLPTTTLEAAREAIPAGVEQHAMHGEGFLILAHQPGTGKGYGTTTGLKAYLRNADAAGQIVWSALRKAQITDQHGLDLIPLHGRNPGNCFKHQEVLTLQAAGYNAHAALCQRRCPFVDRCVYLRQFAQEGDFFATQPMLLATNWWADAEILVLDEFDPGRLTHTIVLAIGDLVAMGRGTTCQHAHALLRWLSNVVGQTGDCCLQGSLLLHTLEAAATDEGSHFRTTLYAAHNNLPSGNDQNTLPGFPQQATLADYQALPPGHLPTLVRQLVHEANQRLRGHIFTSRLEARDGKLHLYLRHDHLLAQLADGLRRTIILDATVNLPLLQAIFPHTNIHMKQPHIPIPSRVIQVISRDWAKSGLRGVHQGDRRDRWHDEVAGRVRPDRPTLVVCTFEREHELREALAARGLTNITVAHYGGLRGSNQYKGYDVILAQIYHPNTEAIIREGRALFAGNATPLDERATMVTRALSDKTGAFWDVEVGTFADTRLAALLEMRREAEMVQAALRGRPFDYPDSQITLLFSMPLPGLPPTEIVEAEASPQSSQGRTTATLAKLITAAQQLLASGTRALTAQMLAHETKTSVTTVRIHWRTIAHTLGLRVSHRRIRRTMPKGGERWYVAEVLIQRGRRVPPAAPRQEPQQKHQVEDDGTVLPAMIDQAHDQCTITHSIYHHSSTNCCLGLFSQFTLCHNRCDRYCSSGGRCSIGLRSRPPT